MFYLGHTPGYHLYISEFVLFLISIHSPKLSCSSGGDVLFVMHILYYVMLSNNVELGIYFFDHEDNCIPLVEYYVF